jgi:pyruvate/2-oxoglutarate dehydrogenase complex dihydrolipoamide dehydrogenase (E3) component
LKTFDAIVIGSGQGGVPLATNFAKLGWRVALIEEAQLGGSCINYGCTPTKTMIASARIADAVRRGPQFGVHAGKPRIDMAEIGAQEQNLTWSGIESRSNNPISPL